MSTRINDLGPDLIGAPRALLEWSPRAAVEARRARLMCTATSLNDDVLSRQKSVAASWRRHARGSGEAMSGRFGKINRKSADPSGSLSNLRLAVPLEIVASRAA